MKKRMGMLIFEFKLKFLQKIIENLKGVSDAES